MVLPPLAAVNVIPNVIDASAFGPVTEGNEIVVTPSVSPGCSLERGNVITDNRNVSGSTIARQIRQWNQAIERETDCLALQQKSNKALASLRDEVDENTKEITRKLDEILPVIKLPTSPTGVPKWLKKFSVGRTMPDFDATIDLLKRTIETARAVSEIAATIQQMKFKLEACAIGSINDVISGSQNAIDNAVNDLSRAIQEEIAEAICRGLTGAGITGDNIVDALDAVQAIDFLLRDVELINQTFDTTLGSSLTRVSQNQDVIADLTGIPPVLNTNSPEEFIASVESDEYAQYRQSLVALVNQPDPFNEQLPTITGTAAYLSELQVSTGVWNTGGVETTFDYQWLRNNIEIAGATNSSYIPTIDDVESRLSCRVLAQTSTATVEVVTVETTPVIFVLPAADRPTLSGATVNDGTLVCTDGTWPFTPTMIQFEFIRVPPSGPTVRVQSLSSNNLYEIKTADIGSAIKCRVVATSFKYTVDTETTPSTIVTS